MRPAWPRVATLRFSLPLVLAASCAVFPEHSVLPDAESVAGDGSGGEISHAPAAGGVAGQDEPASSGGAAGEGVALAGAPPSELGGAAGAAGGSNECSERQVQTIVVAADTWIDAEDRNQRHGGDVQLRVFAGAPERRALFRLALPAPPAGFEPTRATFVLQLETNADVTLAPRQVRLHRLVRDLNAERATWRVAGPGAAWETEGGDFGARLAQAAMPAGTTLGQVEIDVTEAVIKVTPLAPLEISLILLESGTAPPAPGELTFVSADTPGEGKPALVVEYCAP